MALGVVSFFNSKLLAFGNLSFLPGVTLVMGPKNVVKLYVRKSNIIATTFFAFGIVLVALRYCFIGFVLELLGALSLFGDFLGLVLIFLRHIPGLKQILNSPAVGPTVDRLANLRLLPI